ncbi:hypothetical protein A7E78_02510 [Syntrophotalea acetylenivorans]|uniref:DUF4410 domain-containing protein n=1 Tax=Syntrophotalea acetylenivorans TaxID=1842532 RepID=A0A1L3GTG5_9BACT|nr:hypothetical protein A7E78_02510 [Syntrophotalea acetylenivorans]
MITMIVAAGCASTKVDRKQVVSGKLPRPAHIWVYDFAATPADLPIHSTLAAQYAEHSTPQTAEHIAEGHALGAEIQRELVSQIRDMGLIAQHATGSTRLQLNDLVIQGYIVSFEEGETSKRVLVGLGSGSSHLNVAVEGFQMTNQGLRKLGGGTTEAGGGKTPGAAVGAAAWIATANPLGLIVSTGVKLHEEKTGSGKVEGRAKQTAKELAEVLKMRFQEQGWID